MNKRKLGLLVTLGAFLIIGVGLFLYTASRARASLPKRRQGSMFVTLQNFIHAQLPHAWDFQLVGTTGTAVVVGYRADGWRSGLFRGVVPTNFTVFACSRVCLSMKNVGKTTGQMRVRSRGLLSYGSFQGYYPPGYGLLVEHWENPQPGGVVGRECDLFPPDWPVTLPPGMSMREAKMHDFKRDRTKADLKDHLERSARNPQDAKLLGEIGGLNITLKDYPAAEQAYEKFFNSDCTDADFLNRAVYDYVDNCPGTNLQGAYRAALKAQALAPHDPFIADTVGWILVKRGGYKEALPLFKLGEWTVRFHEGMAHYMLMDEDEARKAFQSLDLAKGKPREVEEAKKCLAMLDFKTEGPMPTAVAELKARLAEKPDDPVALDRLGQVFELAGSPTDRLQQDPLAFKAVAMRAYRRTTNAALSVYPRMSAPAPPQPVESAELRAARARLTELYSNFSDESSPVKSQKERIRLLEAKEHTK